ncbi:hypothetical protein EHEL_090500 [Encephalitozoon hellem ATCC 50504]|uniref:Uncharacterized protein n=1 Tax=Encephalitozoon hellem TaxID=27973 RepID=A0A9Q9F8R6_ENCHE|nr:uncharacterized protein EHEL_090500 [Encephalitozoon hellem ATCC 50504]AFM98945.1 hypothetical protein EHEL_090500 [Encephalitozoon hellem ATCC 50504]UTX43959.1 hypothetical protein GPU96_09g17390 [Encephalitozoon hellem]|eukprot:XP_003887926.1 hypothetical protein EHEL_090500 [Encephalitozoon hellem ATCC 50504]
MKFNSADFPIMNRMVVAREDGIHYEIEKNSLADTWDRLLEYYNKKILEEHKEEFEEEELYRMLCKARIEVETGQKVYELVEKGVLGTYKVRPRNVDRCEFKGFILDACIRLLKKGCSELEDAIKKEERVWRSVEGIGVPTKLVSGEVRVYVTDTQYLVANEEGGYVCSNDWNPRGLTCSIRYMDVHLECSVLPKSGMNMVDMAREYFLERSIMQEFSRNDIEIKIAEVEEPSEKNDAICAYVVKELKEGKSIREIFCTVSLYLSRKLVDIIVSNYKRCKVLKYSGSILRDGLPEVFFVLAGNDVIKVVRHIPDRFEIFVNEIPVRFFRRAQPMQVPF